MENLNWLTSEMEEICCGEKEVYELKGKPYIVKKILRKDIDGISLVRKHHHIDSKIPAHIPETSFVLACNKSGKPFLWVIQERIEGRDLNELGFYENSFQRRKLISPQYREMVRQCPDLDPFAGNFIWDGKRKILFYVDS